MTSPATSDQHLPNLKKKTTENAAFDGFGSNFGGVAFCQIHQLVGILLSSSIHICRFASQLNIHNTHLFPAALNEQHEYMRHTSSDVRYAYMHIWRRNLPNSQSTRRYVSLQAITKFQASNIRKASFMQSNNVLNYMENTHRTKTTTHWNSH